MAVNPFFFQIPITEIDVTLSVTNTFYLKLPINCVLAGQQKEPVKMAMGLNGAISGPLRGIFGE